MFRIIISGIFCLVLAVPACAESPELPHVSVYGTALTEVTPDQMKWSVNVRNTGSVLEDVAAEHTRIVREVLDLLNSNKVEEEDTQTSRMEFGENWEYYSGSRVKEGYFASTMISFQISDFEKYHGLWIGLSKLTSVSVRSVYYDHSERIGIQNETRQKAVLAAREKAAALAESLGSEIGEPVSIEEDLTVSEGWMRYGAMSNVAMAAGDEAEGANGLAAGKIPIRIRIKVSFRLLTPGG